MCSLKSHILVKYKGLALQPTTSRLGLLQVQSQSFLTSTLDEGQRLVSYLSKSTSNDRDPSAQWIRG